MKALDLANILFLNICNVKFIETLYINIWTYLCFPELGEQGKWSKILIQFSNACCLLIIHSFQDQSCRKQEYFGQVEEFCFLRELRSPNVFIFQVSPGLDCMELQLGRVQQVPECKSGRTPLTPTLLAWGTGVVRQEWRSFKKKQCLFLE